MSTNETTAVRLLEAALSRDARLVDHLTGLINDVYEVAESGLWRDGATRTTASEVAELIRAQQIAVATRHDGIAGAVRIHDVRDMASEFGMLVAAPEHRGAGVGRALVAFAEHRSRERGLRVMQLELLLPREWRHPSKEFLTAWYGRRGYRHVRTTTIDDAYPHLAPLLATPCDLAVYEKPLQPHGNAIRRGGSGEGDVRHQPVAGRVHDGRKPAAGRADGRRGSAPGRVGVRR